MSTVNQDKRGPSARQVYNWWQYEEPGQSIIKFMSTIENKHVTTYVAVGSSDGSGGARSYDRAPSDRFLDSHNERLFHVATMKLSQERRLTASIPLRLIRSFCLSSVFREALPSAVFGLALEAVDYIDDLEHARRLAYSVIKHVLYRHTEDWRDAGLYQSEVETWLFKLEKIESRLNVCYAAMYVSLRIWIMINELQQKHFYKPNAIAMLNTLFPPYLDELPNCLIDESTLYNYRNFFYRSILAVEEEGPAAMNRFIKHLEPEGSRHSWTGMRSNIDDYMKLADQMITQFSQAFPRLGLDSFSLSNIDYQDLKLVVNSNDPLWKTELERFSFDVIKNICLINHDFKPDLRPEKPLDIEPESISQQERISQLELILQLSQSSQAPLESKPESESGRAPISRSTILPKAITRMRLNTRKEIFTKQDPESSRTFERELEPKLSLVSLETLQASNARSTWQLPSGLQVGINFSQTLSSQLPLNWKIISKSQAKMNLLIKGYLWARCHSRLSRKVSLRLPYSHSFMQTRLENRDSLNPNLNPSEFLSISNAPWNFRLKLDEEMQESMALIPESESARQGSYLMFTSTEAQHSDNIKQPDMLSKSHVLRTPEHRSKDSTLSNKLQIAFPYQDPDDIKAPKPLYEHRHSIISNSHDSLALSNYPRRIPPGTRLSRCMSSNLGASGRIQSRGNLSSFASSALHSSRIPDLIPRPTTPRKSAEASQVLFRSNSRRLSTPSVPSTPSGNPRDRVLWLRSERVATSNMFNVLSPTQLSSIMAHDSMPTASQLVTSSLRNVINSSPMSSSSRSSPEESKEESPTPIQPRRFARIPRLRNLSRLRTTTRSPELGTSVEGESTELDDSDDAFSDSSPTKNKSSPRKTRYSESSSIRSLESPTKHNIPKAERSDDSFKNPGLSIRMPPPASNIPTLVRQGSLEEPFSQFSRTSSIPPPRESLATSRTFPRPSVDDGNGSLDQVTSVLGHPGLNSPLRESTSIDEKPLRPSGIPRLTQSTRMDMFTPQRSVIQSNAFSRTSKLSNRLGEASREREFVEESTESRIPRLRTSITAQAAQSSSYSKIPEPKTPIKTQLYRYGSTSSEAPKLTSSPEPPSPKTTRYGLFSPERLLESRIPIREGLPPQKEISTRESFSTRPNSPVRATSSAQETSSTKDISPSEETSTRRVTSHTKTTSLTKSISPPEVGSSSRPISIKKEPFPREMMLPSRTSMSPRSSISTRELSPTQSRFSMNSDSPNRGRFPVRATSFIEADSPVQPVSSSEGGSPATEMPSTESNPITNMPSTEVSLPTEIKLPIKAPSIRGVISSTPIKSKPAVSGKRASQDKADTSFKGSPRSKLPLRVQAPADASWAEALYSVSKQLDKSEEKDSHLQVPKSRSQSRWSQSPEEGTLSSFGRSILRKTSQAKLSVKQAFHRSDKPAESIQSEQKSSRKSTEAPARTSQEARLSKKTSRKVSSPEVGDEVVQPQNGDSKETGSLTLKARIKRKLSLPSIKEKWADPVEPMPEFTARDTILASSNVEKGKGKEPEELPKPSMQSMNSRNSLDSKTPTGSSGRISRGNPRIGPPEEFVRMWRTKSPSPPKGSLRRVMTVSDIGASSPSESSRTISTHPSNSEKDSINDTLRENLLQKAKNEKKGWLNTPKATQFKWVPDLTPPSGIPSLPAPPASTSASGAGTSAISRVPKVSKMRSLSQLVVKRAKTPKPGDD